MNGSVMSVLNSPEAEIYHQKLLIWRLSTITHVCKYLLFLISRSLTVRFLSFTSVKREILKWINLTHCFSHFSFEDEGFIAVILLWKPFLEIKHHMVPLNWRWVLEQAPYKKDVLHPCLWLIKPLSSVQNANQEGIIWEITYSSLSLRARIRD